MSKTKLTLVTLLIMIGLMGVTDTEAVEPVSAAKPQSLTTELAEIPVPVEPVQAEKIAEGALLLEAALAQVGVTQDCTDLVQNSLAALGYTARRDQGGFDFGVQDVASTFAVQVPADEAQPGDIATTGPNNGGHVWVILDPATNTGVHGGYNGLNTEVVSGGVPITSHTVYRLI